MLLCFLSHPVSGDVAGNLSRARRWLAHLQKAHPERAFIAPWILSIELGEDDADPAQREAGITRSCLIASRCDELWLCGPRVTPGMQLELESWSRTHLYEGLHLEHIGVDLPVAVAAVAVEPLPVVAALMEKLAASLVMAPIAVEPPWSEGPTPAPTPLKAKIPTTRAGEFEQTTTFDPLAPSAKSVEPTPLPVLPAVVAAMTVAKDTATANALGILAPVDMLSALIAAAKSLRELDAVAAKIKETKSGLSVQDLAFLRTDFAAHKAKLEPSIPSFDEISRGA